MFGNNENNDQRGFQFQSAPAPLASPMLSNPVAPSPALSSDIPAAALPVAPQPQPAEPVAPPAPQAQPTDDSLMAIKNDVLASLTPLVSQIEQSPEDKFKTTMMLIQASDNSSLIKEAYAAANQIADSKTRAQALMDIINEINYFTQKSGKKQG